MDYKLTMNEINAYADQAGKLYRQLADKIKANHETFIDPTAQDEQDTNQYATQVAAIFRKAQSCLNSAVGEKQRDINQRYHGDITADQLAEINQLKNYDLSEDELNGYLDKYQSNRALLKAFENIIKDQGWKISGLTYDNEMSMLHYFESQMQVVVDGIAHGSQQTAVPLSSKIAGRLVDARIKQWQTQMSEPYTVARIN